MSIVAQGTLGAVPVTPPGRPKSRASPVARPVQGPPGLYMLSVDSGLLGDRKKELLQVALQVRPHVPLLGLLALSSFEAFGAW
jgi:hypothetical protein